MNLFELLGKIVIDNNEANKGIEETTGLAEKSQSKMTSAFKTVGHAVGAFLTTDKIVSFGKTCINAAADASAASSQFSQVFGDVEGQAASSLAAMAEQTGIVENRMKGSFTKIAAFAKTTGMDSADALKLSERAMYAVADAAAFNDQSLESVTESLQSFLKGNYENDSALGLSCTETTRNAAANKLYGKSFIELSEAEKQLTLLQMVEDANKATGALGQAARESGSWTNETGNLQQSIQDFAGIVGSVLLPVAVKVVGALADAVTWMTENKVVVGILAGVIGAITAAIVAYNAVQAVKNAMQLKEVATVWSLVAAQTAALAPYIAIAAAIGALIAVIVVCVKHWDTIKEAALKAWNGVCQVWQKAKDWFKEKVIDPIKEVFSGLWDFVAGIFDGLFSKKNKLSVEVEETKKTTAKVNGSHVDGLDYVPFDNYVANLHKGESVLTAAEASVWRAGGSGNNSSDIEQILFRMVDYLAIIASGDNSNQIARAVASAVSGMRIDMDGKAVAHTLIPYFRSEERRMGTSFVGW